MILTEMGGGGLIDYFLVIGVDQFQRCTDVLENRRVYRIRNRVTSRFDFPTERVDRSNIGVDLFNFFRTQKRVEAYIDRSGRNYRSIAHLVIQFALDGSGTLAHRR
jgi:hypothetical protein